MRPHATRASRSWVFRVLNPVMRFFMMHSPAAPKRGPLLLLSFTGRRRGKPFSIPVSYAADVDGSLLVPGGGAWKWNLDDGRPAQIRLGGRDLQVSAELVTDAVEIERLLPRLASKSRIMDRFIGVSMDAAGQPDPVSLEKALNDGFAIVRLRPVAELQAGVSR